MRGVVGAPDVDAGRMDGEASMRVNATTTTTTTVAAATTTTTTATAREDDEGEEEVRKHLKPFLVAFEHSLRELRKDVELVPTSAQQDAEDYAIDSLQVLKDLKKKGEETFETNKRMRKEYLVIKEKSIKTMDLLSRM